MSPARPKVRDFTAPEHSLVVAVEASAVYELLLSLYVWGTSDDEYECGSDCFKEFEGALHDSVNRELDRLTGCGEMWLPLIGIAQAAKKVQSVTQFLEYLADLDPVVIRTSLIDGACSKADMTDQDIAAAARGDEAAIAAITDGGELSSGLRNLIEAKPEETRRRLVAVLAGVNTVLEQSISDSLPGLRRDADEKRSLAHSMEAQKLVETATNGVTFNMQTQLTGVLLIPSKIIRPWTVIINHEGMQIFAYSVSDEHLNADPDAPPHYLVELYKALGDERRLRMLAMLSEGDLGLMDIAERVDLAKSTAHHHLRILRSAGLVRVIVGANKAYSLRRDRLPETARLLEAYLTTPDRVSAAAPDPQRS